MRAGYAGATAYGTKSATSATGSVPQMAGLRVRASLPMISAVRLGKSALSMDIVLCATQRCGSTLVVEDMRNTGVLGRPEEWFIPWKSHKTGQNWKAALAGIHKRARSENGVTAVKIMANQLSEIDTCLSTFAPSARQGLFPHVAETFADAVWIWLRRDDIVLQAISRLMAQQTGINHATGKSDDKHFAGNLAKGYDPAYNSHATYRYNAVLRQSTAITLENLTWRQFFETHAIKPIELVYETVVADEPMSHLDAMARAIGQPAPPPRKARRMVKLANEKNMEWRAQFFQDAVKNRFLPKAAALHNAPK